MIAVLSFNLPGTPGATGSTRARVVESHWAMCTGWFQGVQPGITLTSCGPENPARSMAIR